MLRSFKDVLALWTPKQLSRVLPVPYTTAAAMYQRGTIGASHWSRFIEVAADRGENLTAEMLLRFRDQHRAEKDKLAHKTASPARRSTSRQIKSPRIHSLSAP